MSRQSIAIFLQTSKRRRPGFCDAGANVAKRALHALGEASASPTPELIEKVGRVVHSTRDTIAEYLTQLSETGAKNAYLLRHYVR